MDKDPGTKDKTRITWAWGLSIKPTATRLPCQNDGCVGGQVQEKTCGCWRRYCSGHTFDHLLLQCKVKRDSYLITLSQEILHYEHCI